MLIAPGAASLNRRLTVQARATTVDAFGQQTTTWADVYTLWAAITPLAGRELVAAQAVNSETTHEIMLRYRTGIVAAQRLVYQGRIFAVLNVQDVATEHRWLKLLCSEGLLDA